MENQIKFEIKFLRKNIEYNEKNIEKYRHLKSSEFINLEITKLNNEINDQKKQIEILEKTPEIFFNEKKLKNEKEVKIPKKQKFKKQDNNSIQPVFQNFFYVSEKAMNRQCNYFYKVSDSVPEYMKKNLSKMPNNKGYIWRGVYFYGDKKKEKNQPFIVFEKQKNGIMKIHEWNEFYYKLSVKEKNQKPTIIFNNKRKQKHFV